MKCNVARVIRSSCLKHLHQLPNSIKINPLTNPLQVLENRLEREHPKPHHSSCEAGHSNISPNIDKNPIFTLLLLQQLLHRSRYVRSPEGLSFESANNVLVGLFRQAAVIGEGVDEGEFETLNCVGENWVGLWRRVAIEWVNGSVGCNGDLMVVVVEGFGW